MRYRLRTLLIALALGPPLIWAGWWGYGKWREYRERRADQWSSELSLIHGTGQTVESDEAADQPPESN
jgi:hypothetical protein